MPKPSDHCPFCQAEATAVRQSVSGLFHVHCEGCGASGPLCATDDLAWAGWVKANQSSHLLRTVLDETPDIILLKDWDGRFLLANAALARLYGTTPDQLVGQDDGAFNPNAEQVAFYLENVRSIMRSGQTQIVTEESTDVETGKVHHYHSIKKPLIGPNGERRILVIAHDVTELHQANRLIADRERSYDYAMSAAREGIWDWDLRTNIVTHNAKWCELIGLEPDQLSHPMEVLGNFLYEEDRESVMAAINAALEGDGDYEHEHRMRRADGTVIWVLDRGQVVERDAQGKPTRMAGSFANISRRKASEALLQATQEELLRMNRELEQRVAERTAELAKANEELQRQAHRDPLTGLYNRRATMERLEVEWAQFCRSGRAYAVILFDIDHFKQINDLHGHDMGDIALRKVAQAMRERIRTTDHVGRHGGEEFIVILPDTSLEGALALAENIRASVAHMTISGLGHVTVSGGVSLVSSSDTGVDPLMSAIQRADKALYASKHGGRNRINSFLVPDGKA